MTSKELYRRFIRLCEKWPRDEYKVGRDYGEFFRSKLGIKFPHAHQSYIEDFKEFDLKLAALERIVNNTYFNENLLKRSSSSGLESWACSEAISNEGIRSLEKYEENSVINRLKETLSFRYILTTTKASDKTALKHNK